MEKLRQEARMLKIPNWSKMRKKELEDAIRERNTKGTQTGEGLYCDACVREQYQQRCIDEKMYHQKLLESTIRKLHCEWCSSEKMTVDGDLEVCRDCGVVQAD